MKQLRIAPAIVFIFTAALVVAMTGFLAPHLSAHAPVVQLTESLPAFYAGSATTSNSGEYLP